NCARRPRGKNALAMIARLVCAGAMNGLVSDVDPDIRGRMDASVASLAARMDMEANSLPTAARIGMRTREMRDWWLIAAALLLVLVAPFVLVDVPPVLDYPNHLARYFVLAHPDDPGLSQMYAPNWRILPNLGMDLIGVALLHVTEVHIGGRIVLALSL